MRRLTLSALLSFGFCASALAQVPVFELDVDAQTTGNLPAAQVGGATPSPGVRVGDGTPANLTGQAIRMFRNSNEAVLLLCSPVGLGQTTGMRTIMFEYNYLGAGNGSAPESFDIQLLDAQFDPLLTLRVHGNNASGTVGRLFANGTDTMIDLAIGSMHTVQIDVDADTNMCTVTVDAQTPFMRAWLADSDDFSTLQFQLNTQVETGGTTSGTAYVDSITVVDPNDTLQNWLAAANGNWDDGANWSTTTPPVAGSVFIRANSAGDYTATGSATALTVTSLVLANTGGGRSILDLQNNLTTDSLTLNPGGRLQIGTGEEVTVTGDNGVLIAGQVSLDGGRLNAPTLSNSSSTGFSGAGIVNSPLFVNNEGGNISPSGTLQLMGATLNQNGTVNLMNGTLELISPVQYRQLSTGSTFFNGGTLVSPTRLELNAGRFDGPGTLRIGGEFVNDLSDPQMTLDSLDVVLTGATNFEALSENIGKNGHALTGIRNVIDSLTVGNNVLTVDSHFDNDSSVPGLGNETAIYVRDLNLAGTTQDAVGGKVYYLNLVAGTDTFSNYVPLANEPPNAVIDSPTGNITIQAGQGVNVLGSIADVDSSPGSAQFQWTFGDGRSQTVEDPGLVVYVTPGTFTITLRVTDGESLQSVAVASRTITVTEEPIDMNPGPAPGPGPGPEPEPEPQPMGNAPCGVCGQAGAGLSSLFVISFSSWVAQRNMRRRNRRRTK